MIHGSGIERGIYLRIEKEEKAMLMTNKVEQFACVYILILFEEASNIISDYLKGHFVIHSLIPPSPISAKKMNFLHQ